MYGESLFKSVARCRFVDNVMSNVHYGSQMRAGLVGVGCTISDCLFLRNRLYLRDGIENNTKDADYGVAPLVLRSGAKAVNCSFVENSIAGGVVSAGAVSDIDGRATLVNCTFVGNSAAARSGDGVAGATVYVAANGMGFVNCTFSDNAAVTADVYASGTGLFVNLFNTILWATDGDYVSVAGTSLAGKAFASTVKDLGVGATWSVARGLTNADPHFKNRLFWSDDNLHAYRLTGTGRAAIRGEDAYINEAGQYLAMKNDAVDGAWYVLNGTASASAEVGTLTRFDFDEVGDVRPEGQLVRGAVQARVSCGLSVIVK